MAFSLTNKGDDETLVRFFNSKNKNLEKNLRYATNDPFSYLMEEMQPWANNRAHDTDIEETTPTNKTTPQPQPESPLGETKGANSLFAYPTVQDIIKRMGILTPEQQNRKERLEKAGMMSAVFQQLGNVMQGIMGSQGASIPKQQDTATPQMNQMLYQLMDEQAKRQQQGDQMTLAMLMKDLERQQDFKEQKELITWREDERIRRQEEYKNIEIDKFKQLNPIKQQAIIDKLQDTYDWYIANNLVPPQDLLTKLNYTKQEIDYRNQASEGKSKRLAEFNSKLRISEAATKEFNKMYNKDAFVLHVDLGDGKTADHVVSDPQKSTQLKNKIFPELMELAKDPEFLKGENYNYDALARFLEEKQKTWKENAVWSDKDTRDFLVAAAEHPEFYVKYFKDLPTVESYKAQKPPSTSETKTDTGKDNAKKLTDQPDTKKGEEVVEKKSASQIMNESKSADEFVNKMREAGVSAADGYTDEFLKTQYNKYKSQ